MGKCEKELRQYGIELYLIWGGERKFNSDDCVAHHFLGVRLDRSERGIILLDCRGYLIGNLRTYTKGP